MNNFAAVISYRRAAVAFTAFSVIFLAGGTAHAVTANPALPSTLQPSRECDYPVASPPAKGANNDKSCRSTDPKVKEYFDNEGDTEGCTFDLTIAWGDGETKKVPDYPGGPTGLAFLAAHSYTNPGIYTIDISGGVASGDCSFTPGQDQFSYVAAGTPYPEGPPVTVAKMLARAETWIAAKVPYSQTKYYSELQGTYRQDCSGFVSMAWDLPVRELGRQHAHAGPGR